MCGGRARSYQLLLSGCALPMALGSKVGRWSLDWGRKVGWVRVVLLLREKWCLRIPSPESLSKRDVSDLVRTHTNPLLHGYILRPTSSEL